MDIYEEVPLYPTGTALPVRFLRLLPAVSRSDVIECELFCGSLSGTVDFEALSYTWGTFENAPIISVQRQPRQVTQNLAAALRRLRHPDHPRVLWVDALCINQSDDAEKSLQVAQMRQVYTSPRNTQVVVWLGEEGTAPVALQFFETLRLAEEHDTRDSAERTRFFPGLTDVEMVRASKRLDDKLGYASAAGMTLEEFIEKVASPAERAYMTESDFMAKPLDGSVRSIGALIDGYDDELAACDEFFKRPWWSRTWILQEVIHGRAVSVHIGDLDPISIDNLCAIAARYQSFVNIRTGELRLRANNPDGSLLALTATNFEVWLFVTGKARNTVETIATLREKYAAEGDAATAALRTLLLQVRAQLATDPRDKIYGLLGMSTNEYAVEPDYRLSKEEVYISLARKMIKNVLYSLLWVEAPGREIEAGDLPSWVTDHSIPQSYQTVSMNRQWYNFSANKDFPKTEPENAGEPHLSQAPTEKMLLLRGIRVGVITEVRDVLLTSDWQPGTEATLRLFGYESAGVRYNIDQPDGKLGTIRTASWGPCRAVVGDIIIVTPGSSVPLVLRCGAQGSSAGDGHLFVGACWMVTSELQDVGQLGKDPGFSPVMFGSANYGARREEVEVFRIY